MILSTSTSPKSLPSTLSSTVPNSPVHEKDVEKKIQGFTDFLRTVAQESSFADEALKQLEEDRENFFANTHKLCLASGNIKQLPEDFPDWLKLFPNLHEVNLSRNKLSTLPKEFDTIILLCKLNLIENQIKEFPYPLYKLINARKANRRDFHLYLHTNPMRKIPEDMKSIMRMKPTSAYYIKTEDYLATHQVS